MPAEQTGESIPGVDEQQAQRSLPTPFLTKTYQLVDDNSVDDLVSWNEDGTTFIVWRPAEFARDLLPKYFKHNNFSSFVRQLNTYGFRKVVPDRWEFANDCFRKGEKQLLRDIQRRKLVPSPAAAPSPLTAIPTITSSGQEIIVAVPSIKAVSTTNSGDEQVLSSNSSAIDFPTFVSATSYTTPDLIEENDRLRKENALLREELKKLKSLCNGVYHMMSNFAANQPESSGGRGGGGLAEGKSIGLVVEGALRPEVNNCAAVNCDKRNFKDESEMDISDSDSDLDLSPSLRRSQSPRLFGVCLKRRRVDQMQQVHESDIKAGSLYGGTGVPHDFTWLGLDINRSTRNIIQR